MLPLDEQAEDDDEYSYLDRNGENHGKSLAIHPVQVIGQMCLSANYFENSLIELIDIRPPSPISRSGPNRSW